uniref:Uncharacterized protein n=1 Tax=Nelumbo nucifera TaxID=4432 RepID=A0A822XE32_NELNU|nr:TPA_asm: hypothetical protein HUJ06_020053 [Nelumbo nucifera]
MVTQVEAHRTMDDSTIKEMRIVGVALNHRSSHSLSDFPPSLSRFSLSSFSLFSSLTRTPFHCLTYSTRGFSHTPKVLHPSFLRTIVPYL